MNKLNTLMLALAVLVMTPPAVTPAVAMQQMDSSSGMNHGSMNMDHGKMNMQHDGMNMNGDMIMLGDATQNGVKAMAHLKDVHEAMAKMGMKTTHHLMVMFADLATGKPIASGMVAVKIVKPDGETEGPIRLMGMQGHFGVDATLKEKGKYHFNVGTKLADGQKRQYEFNYTLE